MGDDTHVLLSAHPLFYLFILCSLQVYLAFMLIMSSTDPLGHRAFSEQERGESSAGYGSASLHGTSGPPTQSPPCPSSVPHTKAPFSSFPYFLSLVPSSPWLLQYLHRDDNPLPSSWCWQPSDILGPLAVILPSLVALASGSTPPMRVSDWG
jgi:hypothetical protein